MSDLTYDAPVTEGAPEPAGDEWSGPSREEWSELQSTLGYLAQGVAHEQSAIEQSWAQEQAEQLEELLDPFSPHYNPQAYVEWAVAQQLAPVEQYVGELQSVQEHEVAMDHAGDILESLRVPDDAMDAVYDHADGLLADAARELGTSNIEELTALVAAQHGISASDASLHIATTTLAQAAREYHAANAPRPTSLHEVARRWTTQPRDEGGRFSAERPDSLRDVARRHFGG